MSGYRRNGAVVSDSTPKGRYLSKCTQRSPCESPGTTRRLWQPAMSEDAYLHYLMLIVLARQVSSTCVLLGGYLGRGRGGIKTSDELLLEVVPSSGNNEADVTGVGDLFVLGISEAWYWFCGGRLG